MKVHKFAMAVPVAASLLGTCAPVASASPKGGKVRVFVTNQTETKAKILFTGAIGDYGKAISQDANGKVDPNGSFERVTLKQGGFLINATALTKKIDSTKSRINETNCSIAVTATGSGTLGEGTGAYTGIAGKILISVTFAGIAPKTAKGCDLSNNAPTYGLYQSITATGTVRFVTP
ncbi:MAG TPA: hypothetical protein VHV75_11445 [Solirubrobacteraceae bacterium]|nr:hypothetical protein [Solirubrobacteraceae bacterium]